MWSHLLPLAEKISKQAYFIALQRGLILSLPLVLIGAAAQVVRDPPSFWLQQEIYRLLGPQFRYFCNDLVMATFGIASLVVLMGFSIALTHQHNQRLGRRHVNPAVTAAIVIACFFNSVYTAEGTIALESLAFDKGLLAALIVASLGGPLFLALTRIRTLQAPMRALDTDPLVGDLFTVLPAGVLTILLFAIGRAVLPWAIPSRLIDMANFLSVQGLEGIGNDPLMAGAYTLATQIFWFFGIHGPHLLDGIQDRLLGPALAANISSAAQGLPAPYAFTTLFFSFFTRLGGAGSTLCLIGALLLAGQSARNRRIALLSLLPAAFNINEPLLFGLPLVLNPAYAIPFLLVPVAQAFIAYGAIAMGWMPGTNTDVIWTTPVLYSGYLATGSWTGAAVQAVNLLAGLAIYLPFVRGADAISLKRSREAIQTLLGIAENPQAALKERHLLDLTGMPGRMAQALASDMEYAIHSRSQQIYLEYQPQVDVETGRAVGAEALFRWQHPQFGRIAPPIAVTLAEDLGQSNTLGMKVFALACRQRAAWNGKVPEDFIMSINISPSQLLDEHFSARVLAILAKTGAMPHTIGLEITEGTLIGTAMAAVEQLMQLRRLGIKISLDDFGMGHTSLQYLRRLPIDAVKLDRSLSDTGHDNINDHIVRSLVDLSEALDIQVVTEGVEMAQQLRQLMDLGCARFQGYYFSPPLPGAACLAFILDREPSRA